MSIEHLPGELFYHIATFLSADELDACFDTCKSWRYLLNVDTLWKKCCLFEEKYFLSSNEHHKNNDISVMAFVGKTCIWRQRFEHQKNLLHNWSIGNYSVGNTGISFQQISVLRDYVDDDGTHWLFDDGHSGITIWNISSSPILVTKLEEVNNFGSFNFADKMLIFSSNYVRVFQFPPVHGEVKLLYRFKFEMNTILNDDMVISDDDYESGVRYITVGNFFVGYRENVVDIRLTYLHIWDFHKGKKIGVVTAFEQSFVDFIREETGTDIVKGFGGGLLLFPSDSDRFLVNLIDDRYQLCQISLFSIQEMRFLNVVARLKSRTGWCFMKGDVVSIYHENGQGTSHISMYNVNGSLLTTLEFPRLYNPSFTDEFCFSKTKLFLKVADKVHVVSIIDSKKVREHTVLVKEEKYILQYFEPKFLLLYDKVEHHSSTSLTVLDVYTGQELWTLSNLVSLRCYHGMIQHLSYPHKLVVKFEGNSELSILNFGKTKQKLKNK